MSREEMEVPKAKKKGIQFRSRDSIEEVKRISKFTTYDAEELESYWGDSSEFKLRKQELRTAVQEWKQGRRQSDNLTFTTIGIMDKIGEGKAIKKANRAKSRQAVMEEQDLQDQQGIINDDLLADIYSATTTTSKETAHEKAVKLREEVNALPGDEDNNGGFRD
jgi:hypothetical protein